MAAGLLFAPFLAGLAGVVFGWFCVRLSGVYLAMLTLAFAQIAWSVAFQWVELTGGDNGILGVWPSAVGGGQDRLLLSGADPVHGGRARAARHHLRAVRLRPARGPRQPGAGGGHRPQRRRASTGWPSSLPRSRRALPAGSTPTSRAACSRPTWRSRKSVDALLMVLLGGVQTVSGPIVGAFAFAWLQDWLVRAIAEYWRLVLGGAIVVLVLAFPQGLVGSALNWRERSRERRCAGRGGAMSEPVLEAQGLEKAFGGVKAVDGVSFARRGRAAAGADRAERRGQDHLLQPAQRPAPARCRARRLGRTGHHRAARRARSGRWASGAPSRSRPPSRP